MCDSVFRINSQYAIHHSEGVEQLRKLHFETANSNRSQGPVPHALSGEMRQTLSTVLQVILANALKLLCPFQLREKTCDRRLLQYPDSIIILDGKCKFLKYIDHIWDTRDRLLKSPL